MVRQTVTDSGRMNKLRVIKCDQVIEDTPSEVSEEINVFKVDNIGIGPTKTRSVNKDWSNSTKKENPYIKWQISRSVQADEVQ